MFMRIMAIDIGTNSTLSLIADVRGDGIKLLERDIAYNGLGAEIQADNCLPRKVIEMNRLIFSKLLIRARELNVKRISAVGTHALRKAINREEIISAAAEAEIPLRVISDEEEAVLAWRGVVGTQETNSTLMLLDLGGGSTELSIGDSNRISFTESIPLGAVTVRRDFLLNDPPLETEIKLASVNLMKSFEHWEVHNSTNTKLCCIGGTATAIAALEHSVTSYYPGVLEGKSITGIQLRNWSANLLKSNFSDRKSLPGMPPDRAYSIHAGALVLSIIVDTLEFDEFHVSEKGVLFGLALELSDIKTDM